MPSDKYVPNIHYQEERAAILYGVWRQGRISLALADDAPAWEQLDDRERTAWLLVAVEPMPAESAAFID